MSLRASNIEQNSFNTRRRSFGSAALDAEDEARASRASQRASEAEESPRIGYGNPWSIHRVTVKARARGLRGWLSRRSRSSADQGFDDDIFELPHVKARRLYMIVPGGPRKAVWDIVVSFLAVYCAFSVPFELAFTPLPEALEALVDFFFLVDACVSLRVAPIDVDGSPVISPRMAARAYLRRRLVIDFLGLCPFDRIVDAALYASSSPAQPVSAAAGCCTSLAGRLCALLKLLRLSVMRRHSHLVDQLVGARVLHIGRLILILSAVAHWLACLWWLLGSSYARGGRGGGGGGGGGGGTVDSSLLQLPGSGGASWVDRMRLHDETVPVQYLASFYWALTVVVKSPWLHPAPPAEFVFACCTVRAPTVSNLQILSPGGSGDVSLTARLVSDARTCLFCLPLDYTSACLSAAGLSAASCSCTNRAGRSCSRPSCTRGLSAASQPS